MSKILQQIIIQKVYKEAEIQSISAAGGKPVKWIFDFKAESLRSEFLQEYARCFWETFQKRFPQGIQIGGMETGAISLVTGVSVLAPASQRINVFYVRKSRKKNDLANLVEGELNDDPIVLVDDILNAGRTIKKEIKIIEDLGKKVSAVFTCLRFRDISFYRDLADRGVEIVSIFELNDFKGLLPVENITGGDVSIPRTDKYTLEYKIRLTERPNLYNVVPKSAPLLVGEYLYVGADDGMFYCIRAIDGEQIWSHRVWFGIAGKHILSSPVVYGERVIFGAYDGNLYCLNRFSGKQEWIFTDADWIGSSPCIDAARGIVYVGLEFGLSGRRGGVAAININDGRVKWKNYSLPEYVHASPAYSREANLVVCGCNDHSLYAFDPQTGRIIWQFKTGGEVKYGAVFDQDKRLVIFGSMDGSIYALQCRDGMLYHRYEARFGFYSTPVLADHRVIIGSLDKRVYCFDLNNKETAWTFETAGRIFASPIVDGKSVFIGSNDGRLYELEISSGKALAVIQLTERIVNRIQVDHQLNGKRLLYVPTHVCELYRMREV